MDDLITLKDYLSHSIVSPEAEQELIGYLNEAFNRIIATFRLIPDIKDGKLLEIGANPYFLTVLINKYKNYECSLINYFGETCSITSQNINNVKYQENHIFNFLNINLEKETLPYPDHYFDVIVYCEVIEHLTENPVYSLYNLHRVLKDDGILILSTPNVFRYQNLKKILFDRKISIYDPYSGYGIYGRHNREYSMHELEDILTKTGFFITEKKTLYAKDRSGLRRLLSKIIELFQLGDYLLIKTKKRPEFNWYFPDYLYRGTPGLIITDDHVVMGKNCSIHIDNRWNSVEKWEGKGDIRWTKKVSGCYLKPQKAENILVISCYSAFDTFEFRVIISQNNQIISEFNLSADKGWQTLSLTIPEITSDPLSVEFAMAKSWIPRQMGINTDGRELGIAIHEIRLI